MIHWTRVEDGLPEAGIEKLVFSYMCKDGSYDSDIQCLVYHGTNYFFAFYNMDDNSWYNSSKDEKLNVVAWSELNQPQQRFKENNEPDSV